MENFSIFASNQATSSAASNLPISDLVNQSSNSNPVVVQPPPHQHHDILSIFKLFLGCSFSLPALCIWSIGLFSAGQSSTMTGTVSGQYCMEGFLNIYWVKWKRVLLTRSIAILPTLFLALSSDLESMISLNDGLNALMSLQVLWAATCRLRLVDHKL